MHMLLDYEHSTNNSMNATHHKYDTANSQCRTFNYRGKSEYFEHNKTNHGCIMHHYEHSKLNYKPNTANSESRNK